MIRGVVAKETHNSNVLYNQLLVKASGKFLLLSKLLPKLYEEKHQVLIFSQFINTLDLLEDLLALLGYTFDRLDGGVRGGTLKQIYKLKIVLIVLVNRKKCMFIVL